MKVLNSWLVLTGALFFSIQSFARDIAVVDLPKPVVAAIEKAHPGMKLIKAEEDSDHEFHYEVKIELKDRTRRTLDVRPNGTVIKTEISD